ncbi:MAG: hypothetical protein FWG68_09170 [Defluviitaleaceae bacterium]|nr:hypothetical protein [Defluviitaleaceae bacterium]
MITNKNSVVLKGRKDEITIALDSRMPFRDLQTHFHKKILGAKKFFNGAKSNVVFTGRDLTEEEEWRLMDIITAETTLDVPFSRKKGLKTNEKLNPTSPINPIKPTFTPTAPADLLHNVHDTTYHQGGLRSGQAIRHHGSVVVIGDANPGSEIIAGGHVIVLGALKGFVHAGCAGNEETFVSGLVFRPTQLRIANAIVYIPEEHKRKTPACAYMQDGQVFIAPLIN